MPYAEELALSRNFLTLEDVVLLKHIGADLPDSAIVYDLGAGAGTTALAILESHPHAVVRTFDISVDAINWTEEAVRHYGYRDRWLGRVCDATKAARYAPMLADAVLIDASHRYSDTLTELFAWIPKIRSGGWLWCHDYVGDGGMKPEENGVRQAIDETMKDLSDLYSERIERGLGVAFKWK